MVNTNVKIIEELKSFLNMVIEDTEIRKLFSAKPKDFIRHRKLPIKKIIGMLINLPKRSLSIELQSFFESLDQSDFSCTKGAFSLQRTKLKPILFKVWNDFLVKEFYSFYGNDAKRWEEFRLLAVDGSNVSMMNVPEVLQYFGSADNQFGGVPMGRAMQIHDVLNDLTIWGDIFPRKFSENAIIASNIRHLPEDSLTLFDRGYPSYSLIYLLMNEEIPRHFLMRCKTTFNNEVKDFVASKKKNLITTIYPSLESIETLKEHGYIVTKMTGIKIRMLKVVLPDGEIEVLLTNLYDRKIFTSKKISNLYFMRWKIETTYNKQKNQLQMEIFSGHRVVCIEQDYAAGLFVANLQSIIEKQCEEEVKEITKSRRHEYQINRNVSWASLKNRILELFIQPNDSFTILMELQHLFIKNIEPIRPGRHVPRTLPKRKRGKYQTFTNYRRAV
jgi:hypothetical protein